MNNLENAIFAHLIADANITALVNATGGKYHIYPMRLPDGFPDTAQYAITYTEIKQDAIFPLLRKSTVQFSCFARSYDNAMNLAYKLENSLNYLSEVKLGGIKAVNSVMFENKNTLYDEIGKLWYFVVDVSFKY